MTIESLPDSTPKPLPSAHPRRRWLRWIEHALALIGSGLLLMVFTPATQWLYDALDRQTPLAKSKYIICLGGDPARVIEACRLLNEGYGEKLILSNHDEYTDRMRDLALDWGALPADRSSDHRSKKPTTMPGIRDGSCTSIPPRRLIIVTSYTHLARSKAPLRKAGYRPRHARAALGAVSLRRRLEISLPHLPKRQFTNTPPGSNITSAAS
jgi:uncharacterized SAM-binding protein YcdF (DUF218 family)